MRHDNGIRWGAKRIAGVTTLVEVDEATGAAVVIESCRGVVRIQRGYATADGRFVVERDDTLESVCSIEALDTAEPLPLLDEAPRPSLARTVVGTHLALVADCPAGADVCEAAA